MKPTVHDIAREAGVSLATVDRVLNSRPGVRQVTIQKVKVAVERLGYIRDASAANLARQRHYRFAAVLPAGSVQFVQTLQRALEEACASQIADRVVLELISAPTHDPHAIVRTLQGLEADGYDGVALMVPETPQVRDAVTRLKAAGLAVVALVSDLPNAPCDYFVGINSVAAGRTAAQLAGGFTKTAGEWLCVTNAMRSRDSLERRLGFDAVVTERFPHISVLPSVEGFDDSERMGAIVAQVAANRAGLVGIYSMGSGNVALMDALRETGRLPDLTVIAHELTPLTRAGLEAGEIAAVIVQDVGHLARSTLRILRALCDQAPIFEPQERVRIEVVLRENMP